jgi:hypothetical protein
MSHPNLLTVAARMSNPNGGPDLEVRLVVDAGRGVRFELGASGRFVPAVDISPHAPRLRDALTALLYPSGPTRLEVPR